MKSILRNLVLMLSASALLWSCKKDEDRAVVREGTAPSLTLSLANVTLTKATENNNALTVTFTPADFAYKAAVTYTLEFAKSTNAFTTIGTVVLPTNATSQAVNVKAMNIAVLQTGIDTVAPESLKVRLKADIGGGRPPVYSNVVPITVKAYSLNSFLYVPGDYQGWNPGGAPKLISINSTGAFEGFVNMTASSYMFKFTSDPDWNHTNYGSGGADNLSTSGGDLSVASTGAGYYLMKANTGTLKWSATKTTWSIIGDGASGWGTDVPMTYDAAAQVWKATTTLSSSGKIKFRANNDWGINFGDNGANGTLEYGGADISVPASGIKTVILDLHNPGAYTFQIQ